MFSKSFLMLVTVLTCVFPALTGLASHVPGDYATIQEALDNAVPGEEIVVADGTYFENLVWPDVDNITLRGESGDPASCVIDGSGAPLPVVSAILEGTSLKIRDVTVRNGFGDPMSIFRGAGIDLESSSHGDAALENCWIADNAGTGVLAAYVSLGLRECLVEHNLLAGIAVYEADLIADRNVVQETENPDSLALWGGGVGVMIIDESVTVQFTNNIVRNNWWGLGIVVDNYYTETPLVTSLIEGNYFEGNGHPDSLLTGGILLWTMMPSSGTSQAFQINDNNLNNNKGVPAEGSYSGGINVVGEGMVGSITNNYIYGQEGKGAFGILVVAFNDSSVLVDRNLIRDTVGLGPFEPLGGGYFDFIFGGVGLRIEGDASSAMVVTNNFLEGNCPHGVAINTTWEEVSEPNVALLNNTIVNSCEFGIEKGEMAAGQVDLTNLILWGNGDDLVNVSATYSDIEDGDAGEGNISVDPQFVDRSAGDFHLQPGSPCIDRGSNAAPDLPETDYDGDARVRNGVVDMGADEYIGNTPVQTGVKVEFSESGAEVTFDTVVQEGQTTVDKHVGYPPAPEGFLLLSEPAYVYDVESSAGYEGGILVCVEYEEPAGVDESLIRLLHEEAGTYVDRTLLPVDAEHDTVCAEVTGLSEFLPVVLDCADADGDGYAQQACGGRDCDDADSGVNPGAEEYCSNGIDDDCDGFVDGEDPNCAEPVWSVASASAEAATGVEAGTAISEVANWLMLLIAAGLVIVLKRLVSKVPTRNRLFLC